MTVWATRAYQVDLRGPNPHDLARSRNAQVERHVERRASLGDLSFRRLGFLLRVLLPDGSDLGVDAGVAISLGHCELCLSYWVRLFWSDGRSLIQSCG